jgi:hypothetical protein
MDITEGTTFTVDELGFIQTAETKILTAVAHGLLDLNDIARRELASRGLDVDGKWIGFQKARDIYERHRR